MENGLKYIPRDVKPQQTKLYGNVDMPAWEIGGDQMINTQFEYAVVTNANLNRKLPEPNKTWLDAYSIPVLADFGEVKINPAGVILDGTPTSIKYRANLTRSVQAARAAMNKLTSKQYTDLSILTHTPQDANFPVVLLYQLALVRNTERIIAPFLHYQSFLSMLDELSNYTIEAAYRVEMIKKQLTRSRVVAPWKAYIDVLSVTPLHTPSFDTLCEFYKIEKLNDALNTSYDFVKIQYRHSDDEFYQVKEVGDGKAMMQPLLVKTAKTDQLMSRSYLIELLKYFNMSNDEFAANITETFYQMVIYPFVQAWVEMTSAVAALPVIFAPYYTAIDVIAEFIDSSVFNQIDVNKHHVPIRRTSFYSQAHMIHSLKWEQNTDSLYPVFTTVAPLYKGRIKPDDTYDSNGLLLLNTPDELSQTDRIYSPFIDLSNTKLSTVWFATQADLSEYLNWTIISHPEYTIPMYKLNLDNAYATVHIDLKKVSPNTVSFVDILTDPISAFLQYLTVKSHYVMVTVTDKLQDSSIVLKHPELTGSRPITIPTNADTVLELTPKLLGIKPTIPMIR